MKLKAKELRAGNYVKSDGLDCYINFFLGGQCVDLELIGFEYTDDNHEQEIEYLEPIPLTEEWLIKFGFSQACEYPDGRNALHIKSEAPNNHIYVRYGGNDKVNYYIFNHSKCDFTEIQFIRSVKHVHTLQNLYFALTGEELKTTL